MHIAVKDVTLAYHPKMRDVLATPHEKKDLSMACESQASLAVTKLCPRRERKKQKGRGLHANSGIPPPQSISSATASQMLVTFV